MENNKKRVHVLDTIRGGIIIVMVIYHLLFDLYDMFGVNLWWMNSLAMNTVRDIGAGMLIMLAGVSCRLSRSNVKRGIKTLLFALVLSLITYIFIPYNFIFMGILHFMGTMMLLYGLVGEWLNKIPRIAGFVLFFAIFMFVYPVNEGILGIRGLCEIQVPDEWKTSVFTYILGFGGGEYNSADYFSFLPWGPLFLAGTYLGNYVKEGKLWPGMYKDVCKPITWLGRHTLIIYMVHQPVIYGVLTVIFKLIG